MNKTQRFIFSALFLGALLLSACSGAALPQDNSNQNPGSGQDTQVVFTGTVQSMGGGEWNISGQAVGVDGTTAVDANIQVGDIVKVEATVSADGKVFAVRIEASLPDDPGANANGNGNENANSNANANSNENMNGDDNGNDDNGNANGNSNGNGNDNSAPSGPEQEILGAVQAMTKDTITIGGVTYKLANFTEFKTPIVVGDQVKIHVIVNADGSLTIREIEKTTGTGVTTNNNGNDDNGNASNSNDDNGNASNSNDDNGGGSNSNDDNGNDDNGNDDNGGGGSNENDDNGGGGNGNG